MSIVIELGRVWLGERDFGPFTFTSFHSLLLMGFKLMAGAVASCALIGVAVGVGIIDNGKYST